MRMMMTHIFSSLVSCQLARNIKVVLSCLRFLAMNKEPCVSPETLIESTMLAHHHKQNMKSDVCLCVYV
jgi:hypothetical protein